MTSVAHLSADSLKPSTTSASASEISAALEKAWIGKATADQALAIRKANAAVLAGDRTAPSAALKRAKILVGCYRARDFVDVETFITGLVANLCDYPECVVNLVTDPKHGLPATNTFCPAISEVVEACRKASEKIKLGAYALDKLSQ